MISPVMKLSRHDQKPPRLDDVRERAGRQGEQEHRQAARDLHHRNRFRVGVEVGHQPARRGVRHRDAGQRQRGRGPDHGKRRMTERAPARGRGVRRLRGGAGTDAHGLRLSTLASRSARDPCAANPSGRRQTRAANCREKARAQTPDRRTARPTPHLGLGDALSKSARPKARDGSRFCHRGCQNRRQRSLSRRPAVSRAHVPAPRPAAGPNSPAKSPSSPAEAGNRTRRRRRLRREWRADRHRGAQPRGRRARRRRRERRIRRRGDGHDVRCRQTGRLRRTHRGGRAAIRGRRHSRQQRRLFQPDPASRRHARGRRPDAADQPARSAAPWAGLRALEHRKRPSGRDRQHLQHQRRAPGAGLRPLFGQQGGAQQPDQIHGAGMDAARRQGERRRSRTCRDRGRARRFRIPAGSTTTP